MKSCQFFLGLKNNLFLTRDFCFYILMNPSIITKKWKNKKNDRRQKKHIFVPN